MTPKLSDKQRAFCDEYLIDFNGTQAAIRAKYSAKTAHQMGAENLSKPVIQQEIARLQSVRAKRTEVTQDRVLLEIARLAFNDPRKAFAADGQLLPVQQWPDEVAAAISAIKVTELRGEEGVITQLKEVKFWDKGKQLDLAARHLGMLTDKILLALVNPATEMDRLKHKKADATAP